MRCRVLIVEDEPLVAWNLETLIAHLGHELAGTAASSAEALALAAAGTPPGIALLDLNLADGWTGPEIASELAGRYGTLVVAVTGNPDCVEAGRGGFCRIVGKPYTDEMIREVLEWAAEAVRSRGGRGEIAHRSRSTTTV